VRAPHSEESRQRQGATLLGISLGAYRAYVEAGLKWCSGHKAWERRRDFGAHMRYAGGLNSVCRTWDRQSSRERQRRYRAEGRDRWAS
jgi:hypothetical protein